MADSEHEKEENVPPPDAHVKEQKVPTAEVHVEEENVPPPDAHVKEQKVPTAEVHVEEENVPPPDAHVKEQKVPTAEVHVEEENVPPPDAHVKEQKVPTAEVNVEEEKVPPPEAHVKEEGDEEKKAVTTFLHTLVCKLCNKIFKDKPVVCSRTYCRSCLETGLQDDLDHHMVCTLRSLSMNQQCDFEQDILTLMHLRAKYKDGNCRNLAVHLLCQELNRVLNITATKPCKKKCKTCSMVTLTNIESIALTGSDGNTELGPYGNTVIGPNGKTVVVEGKFTCQSKNVIYFIYCRRKECRKAYIGQTTDRLQDRMKTHRSKIKTTKTTSIVQHFNLPNHTVEDCKVCVIKRFKTNTVNLNKVMGDAEDRLIKLLGTKYPHGLNMNKGN